MDWRRCCTAGTQTSSNDAPNSAIAACLIIETPFQHPKDHIIVTNYELPNLSSLSIGQSGCVGFPLIANPARYALKHLKRARVERLIDIENQATEIREAGG